MNTTDLTTCYLGLQLAHPIVASASPLTGSLESLLHLQRAGAAAVVLPSLFEEQIEHELEEFERLETLHADANAESVNFYPDLDRYNTGPEEYLRAVCEAKENLDIPVIASLNGFSSRGWKYYAGLLEQAGADALELNIYLVPTDPNVSSSDLERHYFNLVRSIREQLSIPLAVKIGPHFTSPANVVGNLADAGAAGIVLFNRFLSPDIDLEQLEYVPALELSEPDELRAALRFIAIARDHYDVSLAATGGVHSAEDVVKAVLAGADAVMVASTLLKHGIDHLTRMLDDLSRWLIDHDYQSIRQMRGSMSLNHCSDPETLKRANYMKALTKYTPTQTP